MIARANVTFEVPLNDLDGFWDRRRRLQAELAQLESRIEAKEAEACRALRAARRDGIAGVVRGDSAFYERDGRLHAEHWPAAHEVNYDPAGADGSDWHPDDVVTIPPGAPVPEGYDPLHGPGTEWAYDRDGRVIGSRGEDGEDRSC